MNQRGVTLIELLIAIALASAVGLFIMQMYITSNRTYMDQNRILDAQRSGRLTLEAMARVLRETGLDPRGDAGAGIEVGEDSEIRITRDLNMDGAVTGAGEQVTFKLFGTVLRRGDGAPGAETWRDLASNVSAFTVEYFDGNNAAIATPVTVGNLPNVRSLLVTLTFQDDKASGGSFERTYTTGITCRNLFR